MTYQIVYLSSASKGFSRLDLLDLLQECRSRNRERGITGFLMYHDQQFFQVLEGEENAIQQCYVAISADPRHRGIITLVQGPARQRMFTGWDMGLLICDQ